MDALHLIPRRPWSTGCHRLGPWKGQPQATWHPEGLSGENETHPACLPACGLTAFQGQSRKQDIPSWTFGSQDHLLLGTSEGLPLGQPLSGQTCIPGGHPSLVLSTQMLAHSRGYSAPLMFTVCLENAPRSKGIEATTTSKVTAQPRRAQPSPGMASASGEWAPGFHCRPCSRPNFLTADDSSPGGSVYGGEGVMAKTR